MFFWILLFLKKLPLQLLECDYFDYITKSDIQFKHYTDVSVQV